MSEGQVKRKQQTAEAILKRPLKRSMVHAEVQEEVILVKCIGFCKPARTFRAVSKINKICPQCKESERWRDY